MQNFIDVTFDLLAQFTGGRGGIEHGIVHFGIPARLQSLTILTHLSVKEDAHTLYGFGSEGERTLFRQLLKISGIGAKLALSILSGASGDELARYVADRDAAALTRLPGIGKKTAERIIIELRDKLDYLPAGAAPAATGQPARAGGPVGEATNALIALGYKPQEAGRMAREVAGADMAVEEIIRQALQSRVRSL